MTKTKLAHIERSAEYNDVRMQHILVLSTCFDYDNKLRKSIYYRPNTVGARVRYRTDGSRQRHENRYRPAVRAASRLSTCPTCPEKNHGYQKENCPVIASEK